MRLAPNWRAVLRYAWSIRLILIAALLSGAEVALPLVGDALPVPDRLFAALSFLTTAGAFLARLTAQKGVSDE
ncbi:MAG TPA: hypothetical protein VGN93_31075 [Shinella sp.]|jgi:hypothetical protein|uniref:DUF7940 domain-containing protein n=1 Tax=Shinella sp. TaxID=1870904 RepID=UPI002E14FAD5|nr:hypothetical protein [Shinella sp.]